MSFALRAVGANSDVGSGGTLTPGAPAGVQVGDLLLLYCATRNNGDRLTTPSGWTQLSTSANVAWNYLYGRIADGTGADTPTMSYSSSGHTYACIAAFTGGPSTLAGIFNVASDQYLPGSQTWVEYTGITPTSANCLVIAATTKNKTATSNGTTFNAFTGMTALDHFDGASANGTNVSVYWGYVAQSSPNSIASGTQTLTGTTETLQYTSILLALQPANNLAAAQYTYAYSLEGVTFSTSQGNTFMMGASALSYNYVLAPSTSDFELDPSVIPYSYTLNSATFAVSSSVFTLSAASIPYTYTVEAATLRQPALNFALAAASINYSISPGITSFVYVPNIPTGSFPYLSGLSLQEAESALQASGALNPAALGYFGSWPITVLWVQSTAAAGTVMQPGLVVGQVPAPASVIVENAPITLTVIEQPTSVSYPGTNPSINEPVP